MEKVSVEKKKGKSNQIQLQPCRDHAVRTAAKSRWEEKYIELWAYRQASSTEGDGV